MQKALPTLIWAVTLLLLAFMFKSSFEDLFRRADCTNLEFFEVKLKICDDNSEISIRKEEKQIANLVKNLQDQHLALTKVNEKLEKELAVCNTSTNAQRAIQEAQSERARFEILRPRIDIYNHANLSNIGSTN